MAGQPSIGTAGRGDTQPGDVRTRRSEEAGSTPDARPAAAPYRWRWLVLAAVLTAEVMDLLDATIINVAAPSIAGDLGGSTTALQWTIAGYTLAFAIMLITGGRLGDIVGRRRMFLLGAAGFTLASVACALAGSMEVLIASRVAQGLLGAVMIPQGLGMIKTVFPPKEVAGAFGAFGPVMGLSAVCGPILAGVLIDADLFGTGWRMIFLINVPFGLAALFLGARFMPESRAARRPRLDVVGMVLVGVAASLLIFPLVQGREYGWPAWTFAMLASALPVLGLFVVHERRRGDSALIEPSLFRNRAYTSGLAVLVSFFAGLGGFMLTFNVFTQGGLGYSPMRAGLALGPWSLGMAVGAAVAGGALVPRFGRRVLHAGLVLLVVGVVGLVATLQLTDQPGIWDLAPATFVAGLGAGLVIAPLFDIVLAGVEEHEVGSAAGVLAAVQQLATALGVAVLGTLFFDSLPELGFLAAMRLTGWAVAGVFAIGIPLALLLPRSVRAESQH